MSMKILCAISTLLVPSILVRALVLPHGQTSFNEVQLTSLDKTLPEEFKDAPIRMGPLARIWYTSFLKQASHLAHIQKKLLKNAEAAGSRKQGDLIQNINNETDESLGHINALIPK